MQNRSETSIDPSERLQLKIAQALRNTRLVRESASKAESHSCAVCGSKLADSPAATDAAAAPIFSSLNKQTWICSACFKKFSKLAAWNLESPYRRSLHLPITTDQIHPLDPRCQIVQFAILSGVQLTEADFQLVAGFLRQYPEIPFRVYGGHPALKDLEFLRHFGFVRKFQVDVWDLANLDGLRFLPPELEALGVGSTKSKRHSLRFLERFPALKRLFLEGHSKDFQVVGSLGRLESLTLRSITLPDLSALTRLNQLKSLDIKLGGTKDLRLAPGIGRLRYLELWMIRGLTDLSFIGDLEYLQHLVLESLKHVSTLPLFRNLRSLRRVKLQNMKGIRDLRSISEAPALEDLLTFEMVHLKPEDFGPFVGHRTLRTVSVGLGGRRKDATVHAMLGLPTVEGKFQFSADDQEDQAQISLRCDPAP